MKLHCPKCNAEIPREDVCVPDETAFCVECQSDFDCKAWVESELLSAKNLESPPSAAEYQAFPDGFRVVVSARSFSVIPYLLLALFFGAFGALLTWGLFHLISGDRMTFLGIVVLIDTVAAAFWMATLYKVFGKIAIEVRGDAGAVRRYLGWFGRTQRFDWSAVDRVRMNTHYVKNGNEEQIVLEGAGLLEVARGVRHDRLVFMLTALRHHFKRRRENCPSP